MGDGLRGKGYSTVKTYIEMPPSAKREGFFQIILFVGPADTLAARNYKR